MTGDIRVLDRAGLDRLVEVLLAEGYRVVGPTVRDDAIVPAELGSAAELPAGWSVDTAPGRYRLRRRTDAAVFAHSAGPQSWKRFLHPPHRPLWHTGPGGEYVAADDDVPRYAFLGVRACDLAAISVLGTVLAASGAFARRRQGLFTVAANCTEPGGVCFCASMGTGPGASGGYDLALTERIDDDGHRFVVDVGSAEGARILGLVTTRAAADGEVATARADVAAAAGKMGREMPPGDLRTLLRESRESPVWSEIASRCLTCGNCTMVCPTCFCTTTEDGTDVTGEHAGRAERWASCFELDFSYVHGGSVRESGQSRYRQWMSHKLSTWHDQFGTSGCVGCGRCIAWCPAGIDITAEAARLAGEGAGHAGG
ncbi:4Fe-4S dicluster domain-containing protein [Amycolatopsis stemonae]